MAYISKGLALKAYLSLSSLTEDHKQGQTQIVSAIRHLLAFDMYYKEKNANCDLNIADERNLFVNKVRKLVTIKDDYYTTNFYTTLKLLEDCGVGSNFTSAGVVNISRQNTTKTYDYPTRGRYPLFNVRDAVLMRNTSYYKNVRHYLYTETLRCAFVVWVVRNEYLPSLTLEAIKGKLSTLFTKELLDSLLPKEENFLSYIDGEIASDYRCEIDKSDILALFQSKENSSSNVNKYRPYLTAIKSKPFLLLAGISGTGKSRIVRELARACWEVGSDEYRAQKPSNFEMVQVKPNWHDSSELIGYVSRINGEKFIVGPFLKFLVKALQNPDIPHFLCLDEMNLAPVEQYFAEYLSVVESRRVNEDGEVETDPIVDFEATDAYKSLIDQLFVGNEDERRAYLTEENGKRLTLPANLIVVGTVNMDETTFSFSRKVLDRAMTIEMNEVDLYGGLLKRHEPIGKIGCAELTGRAVEGADVYRDHQEVCDMALEFLGRLNHELEGTPFKVAYRTRNEYLLYVVNNLPYNRDAEGNELPLGYVVARALDEITSMKVLSRIEGDETKVQDALLDKLMAAIEAGLKEISDEEHPVESVSLRKLREMKQRLASGYTSFWS